MVTVLMCASVFQRRSRDGFLDDLETVRGDALTAPRGEVATAVAMADAAVAQDRVDGNGDENEPEWHGWPGEEDLVDESEDIWAPPSPHPIRPQEMWHAGSAPTKFGAPGGNGDRPPAPPEEPARISEVPLGPAAAYDDLPYAEDDEAASAESGPRRRFARFRAADAPVAEHEAVTAGPEAPILPSADTSGLLGGPVGRRDRNRRDRRPLPTAQPLRAHVERPGERSPLVEAPLPPAAPPAEASASQPPPSPVEAVDSPADPAPTPTGQPCSQLVIDDRSELAVGATVVRFGDGSRTSMDHGDEGPVLQVDEGWCWVTVRGDGPRVPVRIQLPNGDLVVVAGGRALAVVEVDRSSFVVIVDGSAELLRAGASLALGPGSMVLLPAEGDPQVDRAEPDEVASDPLVAQNVAMDAQEPHR